MEKIEQLLEKARKHCREEIQPNVDTWIKSGVWPRKSSQKAAQLGLTGIFCPEEYGGQNLSLADGIRVYEELGKGDGAYAFTLSMHNVCSYAVCGFATETFKNNWAKDLVSGKKLANFSLTEPSSGSDPVNMKTRGHLNSDGSYTISGEKAWVSLAGEADVYLVVFKTSDEPGYKDMAMIAVPANSEGLGFGKRYETPSYNFLPISEMYLDKVRVPGENMILPVGKGLSGALMAIDIARVSIASGCCGLMEKALDTALQYAKNRIIFGSDSLKLDGIRWMLGDVFTDLEISRLLYQKAAASLGTEEGTLFAAHAKRFVPDAALRAANTCTHVLGGMGLLEPYGMDRLCRLAQMFKIVDGSTEIQRVVIGRALEKRAKTLPPIQPSPYSR